MTSQAFITRPTLVPPPAGHEATEVDQLWEEIGHFLNCTLDVQYPDASKSKEKADKGEAATVVATITNEAPSAPDVPYIVFRGIRLDVLPLRVNKRQPSWAGSSKTEFRRTKEEPREDPSDAVLSWPDGKPLSPSLPGATLLPGESVRFRMEVPTADLPYFDYRLMAQLSWPHFSSPSRRLKPPAELVRPPMVRSLRSFNELRLHSPLLGTLRVFPEFNSHTSAEDLRPIRNAITNELPHIHALRRRLDVLGADAPHESIEKLARRASDYLLSVHEACSLLDRGLATTVVEEIRGGIQAFEKVRVAANEVNTLTEQIMDSNGVSDEEAAYLYR